MTNGGAPSMRHRGVAEAVFLINIRDRLTLLSAIPIGEASAGPSPFVLTVRSVDQSMLANIGERLQLADLRMVGHEPDLSSEVARLTGARAKLRKGGLVIVDGSTLIALLRPRDLAAIAANAGS